MYLDHSAIVAVLLKDDGWEEIARRIETHRGELIITRQSIYSAITSIARSKHTPVRPKDAAEGVAELLRHAAVEEIKLTVYDLMAIVDGRQKLLSAPGKDQLSPDDLKILGVAQTRQADIIAADGRFADL